MKKVAGIAVLLFVLTLSAYFFRHPLLRQAAVFLICEDTLQPAEALFVLSGGGYDRGNEAVKLYRQGYIPQIVCTGGNPVIELKVFNIDTLESDMTIANLKRQGIPDSVIVALRKGTSTREEALLIENYCEQKQLKKIIVLSSKLHTHRIKQVFRKRFADKGIHLMIHGAPSSQFDELLWWQSEDGLIAINNEWLKTIYYWWKY